MHNIKEIRTNLNFFKKKIFERNSSINLDSLIILDKENRELIQQKEQKEQEKKLLSKSKDSSNFQKSKE
jgi:seryl-tRNA synthetase